jgi:hypothetical protein
MTIWDELGIEETRDAAAIRRAYASRLKKVRPEDDAEGFMRLRAAYETAIAQARREPVRATTEGAEFASPRRVDVAPDAQQWTVPVAGAEPARHVPVTPPPRKQNWRQLAREAAKASVDAFAKDSADAAAHLRDRLRSEDWMQLDHAALLQTELARQALDRTLSQSALVALAEAAGWTDRTEFAQEPRLTEMLQQAVAGARAWSSFIGNALDDEYPMLTRWYGVRDNASARFWRSRTSRATALHELMRMRLLCPGLADMLERDFDVQVQLLKQPRLAFRSSWTSTIVAVGGAGAVLSLLLPSPLAQLLLELGTMAMVLGAGMILWNFSNGWSRTMFEELPGLMMGPRLARIPVAAHLALIGADVCITGAVLDWIFPPGAWGLQVLGWLAMAGAAFWMFMLTLKRIDLPAIWLALFWMSVPGWALIACLPTLRPVAVVASGGSTAGFPGPGLQLQWTFALLNVCACVALALWRWLRQDPHGFFFKLGAVLKGVLNVALFVGVLASQVLLVALADNNLVDLPLPLHWPYWAGVTLLVASVFLMQPVVGLKATSSSARPSQPHEQSKRGEDTFYSPTPPGGSGNSGQWIWFALIAISVLSRLASSMH